MFLRFHYRRGTSNSTPTSPIPPSSDQLVGCEVATEQQQQQPHHHQDLPQRTISNSSILDTAGPAKTAAAAAGNTTVSVATATNPPNFSTFSPPSNMSTSQLPSSRLSVITPSTDTTSEVPTNATPLHDNSPSFASPRASYSAPSTSLDHRRPSQQPSQPVPQSPQRRQNGAHNLSTAAAAAATVNAAKRPSTSLSMASSPPINANTTSAQTYGTLERRITRSKPSPNPSSTKPASGQQLPIQTVSGSQGRDLRSGGRSATSFVTPTDLQSSAAAAASAAASAANMANDAYNNSSSIALKTRKSSAASAAAAANAQTKKSSLPFLRKNPVSSLLGRRKNTSSTDIAGMALANADGPVYVPIRGTRFHDFSAPGPRHAAPTDAPPANPSVSNTAAAAAMAAIVNASTSSKLFSVGHSSKFYPRVASPSTNNFPPSHSTVPVVGAGEDAVPALTPQLVASDSSSNDDLPVRMSQTALQQTSAATSSLPTSRNSTVTSDGTQDNVLTPIDHSVADLCEIPMCTSSQSTLQTPVEAQSLSLTEDPLPGRLTMPGSPQNGDAIEQLGLGPDLCSVQTTTTSTGLPTTLADAPSIQNSSPSIGTTRPRNASLSDLSPHTITTKATNDLPPTLVTAPVSVSFQPKHMKSTSSRFSFMIGSASEEKLLEERHRKKEAEKKATGGGVSQNADCVNGLGVRDSRFDDFDEDDFDYDAVMDDDVSGYEEDDAHLFGSQDDCKEEELLYSGAGKSESPPSTNQLSQLRLSQPTTEVPPNTLEVNESEIQTLRAEPDNDDPEYEDPDNDQENFAGFVFQRSNPSSSLISPTSAGILLTPRDTLGHGFGFAMTDGAKTDPHSPSASLSPLDANGTTPYISGNMTVPGYDEDLGLHVSECEDTLGQYEMDDLSGDDYGEEYPGEYGDDDDHDQEWMDHGHNRNGLSTALAAVGTLPQTQEPEATTQNPQLEDQLPGNVNRASLADMSVEKDNDDLYYDQGLIDELDFGVAERSGPAFDESIFDLNDTDEYGRPIPGAFAAAQAAQHAMTEGIGAASACSEVLSGVPSSASLNESQVVANHGRSGQALSLPNGEDEQHSGSPSIPLPSSQFAVSHKDDDPRRALRRQLPPILTDAQRVDAYQAALAAAAHKAAASGKFRRDSSSTCFSPDSTSSPPTFQIDGVCKTGLGLQGLSLGDDSESAVQASSPLSASDGDGLSSGIEGGHLASEFTSKSDFEYEFGFEDDNDAYKQDMDDYDFDDAIIAEANAEALANDMDGFYSQEFNFYAAPGHQPRNATEREGIQFANGGYFIPAGVGRSTSGRVVSREPNLTPITERSEYSNRNSVMSLAVPPYGSSTELRSPGLAQLALVTEGDNSELSLSSLLRLRSRTFGGGGGSQASLNSSREGSPMFMSGPYSNHNHGNYNDRDRDRGDRDNASSPFAGPTPSQLLLLQKQYPLPAQYQYHHRVNSNMSFSPRGGAASSCLESERGSDSGSPTLTSLLPADSGGSGSNTLSLPLPTSPIMPNLSSGHSNCPPVLEEEDETVPETEAVVQSDLLPYETCGISASGISSASETVLWMQSPMQRDNSRTSNSYGGDTVSSGSKERHTLPPARRQQLRQKQLYDFEVQALEQQLQVKECETEQIQKQMQQLLLLQQQQQQQQQQMDSECTSPVSPRGSLSAFGMPSRRPKGHRHKSSSDSISYIREEEEESGESRWVMERRRLADTGEIEIEREIVDGI
ncbi:hypothetical protein SEPCBS57363_001568 [Sporothrix epigloea]|uniref:Uncharacterized protein n=1 Tax=Sporothrix epigloea TaxID=1892477 RepID=A0ABP0DC58_9PEZI